MNPLLYIRFISSLLISLTFYLLLHFGFTAIESPRTGESFSLLPLDRGSQRLWIPRLELTREGVPIWESQKGIDPKTPMTNWGHGWVTSKWINNKGQEVDDSKTLVQNYIVCGKSPPNKEIIYFPGSVRNGLVHLPEEPLIYFPSSDIVGKVSINTPIREFWYLMVERGNLPTAWLEGYEAVSGKPLGYFGAKGHQFHKPALSERIVLSHYGPTSLAGFWISGFNYENKPGYPNKRTDPHPTEYSGDGNLWISTPESIQEINIVHRSIQEITKTLGDVQIKLLPGPMIEKTPTGNTISTGADYMLFVQSKNEIRLLDQHGVVRGKAFAPKEGWPESYCIFGDPKYGLSLTYATDSPAIACPERRQLIDPKLLSADGKIHQILKHYTPDGKVAQEGHLSIEPIPAMHFLNENGPPFLQCFSNPLYGFFPFLEAEPFQFPKPNLYPWILLGTLFNLFLIVLMAMRQRQFGESLWTIPLWGLLIVVFGLAGWLGYRFHRVWPPLVCCGNCKAKRPCNLAQCPRCQAPFAKPVRNGKEILQEAFTLPALGGI